jgi:tryptophan-rich sensory protein
MKPWDAAKLALAIIICEAAGAVGSVFTAPAIPTWYASLNKPWFTPPGWFIGAAWIVLYFLMGVSLYLVCKKGFSKYKVKEATALFALQLALNVSWSFAFFGMKSPLNGLVVIIALWAAVYVTMKSFKKIDKTAGRLMLPYIAWVTFAALLNLAVAVAN